MGRRWLRIAHRGASGTAPEHTRPAFQRAVALGVDMIELDVQLSRDEKLIVMHDLDLGRTTNGHGCVRDHDDQHLRRLDAGAWFSPDFRGEPVLTLPQVFEVVGPRVALNVEVKAPEADWESLSERLLDALSNDGRLESTIISCFEAGALEVLRRRNDRVRLGVLWHNTEFEEAWRWARQLRASAVHPFWMSVDLEVVEAAHALGLQVIAWTVNDVAAMRSLVDVGVDGLISDFPERFALVEPNGPS